MKKYFLITLFYLSTFLANAQVKPKKLTKQKIYDNKITVYIPKADFRVMTQQEFAKTFAGYREPIAAYTSTDSYVNYTVNEALTHVPSDARQTFVGKDGKMYKYQAQWSVEDLRMMHGLYKGAIQKLHDKVIFLKDGVKQFNKRNFVYFEFIGSIKDEKSSVTSRIKVKRQYSYILYTVEGSKILIFNFTCPDLVRKKWRKTVEAMMNKIKISKLSE